MNRRRFLRTSVAGLSGVSLAGCSLLGPDSAGEPSTESPTDQPETATGTPTPEADGIHPIEFATVVNAVDDLGMDPNGSEPVDDAIDETLSGDVLVEFPPGRYLVTRSHRPEVLNSWGIRGLGDKRTEVEFVGPKGEVLTIFDIRSGRNILMENLTFNQRNTPTGSLGNVVKGQDNIQLRKLKHRGFEPDQDTGATSKLNILVENPNGTAVVEDYDLRMGFEQAPYPKNAVAMWSGPTHTGTLYMRDIYMENLQGLYMSRTEGDVRVENCHFKNTDGESVRVSGEGSYIENTLFVVDHDDSYNVDGEHEFTLPIRWESGFQGKTGGHIRGCEIQCRSVNKPAALVRVDGNVGAVTISDTKIQCDADNVPIIEAREPGSTRSIDGLPKKPWSVIMDRVTIAGKGAGTAKVPVVQIVGRSGSTISNCAIDMERYVSGISLTDAQNCVIANTDINVEDSNILLKNATLSDLPGL